MTKFNAEPLKFKLCLVMSWLLYSTQYKCYNINGIPVLCSLWVNVNCRLIVAKQNTSFESVLTITKIIFNY